MNGFEFNKVYVIESLDEKKDKLTGTDLYNDLLKWKEFQITDFKAELISVTDKSELFDQLKYIQKECLEKGFCPILHLEVHGHNEHLGLVLKSGQLITWGELYQDLISLNSIIGHNLFITMAVCHGAYIMELIQSSNPAPFWGFIGSFAIITVSDLMIRYNEFYDEFLQSFDLSKSIQQLHQCNPGIPSTYRFINSEETFIDMYKNYLKDKFSKYQIKERFKDGLKKNNWKIKNKKIRNEYRAHFEKELLKTKETYFEDHKRIFFMIDKFPENEKRFPITFNQIS